MSRLGQHVGRKMYPLQITMSRRGMICRADIVACLTARLLGGESACSTNISIPNGTKKRKIASFIKIPSFSFHKASVLNYYDFIRNRFIINALFQNISTLAIFFLLIAQLVEKGGNLSYKTLNLLLKQHCSSLLSSAEKPSLKGVLQSRLPDLHCIGSIVFLTVAH